MASPGAAVLVSNHTSYFDVLVLMATLGVDYHFVAKKEVHTMPFIGTFLRKLGHFRLTAAIPQARLRQAEQMRTLCAAANRSSFFPRARSRDRQACGHFTWARSSRGRYRWLPDRAGGVAGDAAVSARRDVSAAAGARWA